MTEIISGMIISCLLTIGLEASVASIFLIKKNEYKFIIIINIITNLILNGFYHLILLLNNNIITLCYIIIGEIIVFYVEALYYSRLIDLKINKYYFSLLLNGISFMIGLIVHYIY